MVFLLSKVVLGCLWLVFIVVEIEGMFGILCLRVCFSSIRLSSIRFCFRICFHFYGLF